MEIKIRMTVKERKSRKKRKEKKGSGRHEKERKARIVCMHSVSLEK